MYGPSSVRKSCEVVLISWKVLEELRGEAVILERLPCIKPNGGIILGMGGEGKTAKPTKG